MIGDYTKINFVDNVTPLNADNMGQMDEKIAELDQNAESVDTDLTGIQDAVDKAQSTADSAVSKNTEQDTSINTNSTDIESLQTENAELKAQIAEMEEEISELNSDLTDNFVVSSNTDDYYCDYEKLPNGKLIINQKIHCSVSIDSVQGSIYYGIISCEDYPYPVEFIAPPSVIVYSEGGASYGFCGNYEENGIALSTTTPPYVILYRGGSRSDTTTDILIHSEGRWK